MASVSRVLLLACGSFNPITHMHLRMFELARDWLNGTKRYKVIGGVISPASDSYGKKDLASAKHRCAMVALAVQSSDWLKLDSWESEQATWSETVKVLRHTRSELLESLEDVGKLPETPSKKLKHDPDLLGVNKNLDHTLVMLLCGADLLGSFSTPGLWKSDDIEEILRDYGIVCITRGGFDARKSVYESDILHRHRDKIHIVSDWIYNDVSATKIRRAIRRRESVKYLLQDSVIDYIKTYNLYSTLESE